MIDPFHPAFPAGAYDELVDRFRASSSANVAWQEGDEALPALFISHGAPPLLDDASWMQQLSAWANAMARPRGIVIISAHWESAPVMLSATAAATPLVYDFSGFAPRYSTLQYRTPDAEALAELVASVMPDAEPVHRHHSRGLDHGAWVPLMVMYPNGDVPVLQLSLPTQDPQRLIDLGARLRPLRERGVLIIGSGFMTHGLPFLTARAFAGEVPGWSADFDAWAEDALSRGDLEELSSFAHRAPGMPYAHPTVEHLVPLFVTLGASSDPEQPVRTTIDGWMYGLSRRSFAAA